MEEGKAWDKEIKAKSASAQTNSSWKMNMASTKVGYSEITINLDKIQDMCNPSHFLSILSLAENYCCPKMEQLFYIHVGFGFVVQYSLIGFLLISYFFQYRD